MTRRMTPLLTMGLLILTLCGLTLPHRADAHFSYSDPRIVHVSETDSGGMTILVRMPAPLALLPADWQGSADTRLPPFARRSGAAILLDAEALATGANDFHQILKNGLSVWVDGQPQELQVNRTRFWPDSDRPAFGTAKSALKSLGRTPPDSGLPYFDSTLDVEFLLPDGALDAAIRIESDQGATFRVIEKFGTVVKLYRAGGWETQAMIGVLRADFPGVRTGWQNLAAIALIGAEHIYLGLDHLAMILLIAIAASGWRQALVWASAFTGGHILTLAAGLYGYAPQAGWFIPVIEFLIVSSIVVAGGAIVLRMPHVVSGPVLFVIGLIHGYGFASAADVALFAGDVNAAALAAFALGLELCQLAVYLAILPIIVVLDRTDFASGPRWRRPVALALAAAAGLSVIQHLIHAAGYPVA